MGLFGSHARVGASAAGDYEIERSSRYNSSDSSYLHRTPSSTSSRTTFTFSFWAKFTAEDDSGAVFGVWQDNTSRDTLRFLSGQINLQCGQHGENLQTSGYFRDESAWYHIVCAVDSTQASSGDRGVIYVNNVAQELGTNTISQDREFKINTDNKHVIGCRWLSDAYDMGFNGYLADFHFVDGSQLTPSSFGETNTDTGEWVPKKYAGSHGTNGYYLKWTDNSGTTSTTLGKDSSGNGNNWTPVNLATGDSVKDTPTNNFATLRMINVPIESGASLSEGNLKWVSGSGTSARNQNKQAISNILVNSGKWYSECRMGTALGFIGVGPYQINIGPTANNTRYAYLYGHDGNKYVNTNGSESIAAHASSYTTGDILGVYLDMDASPPAVYFSKNGQWADGSGNFDESSPTSAINLDNSFLTTSVGGKVNEGTCGFIYSSSGSANNVNAIVNFGQDSTFAGNETAGGNTDANAIGDFKYTVPTNALALCTSNLSDPTIKKPTDYHKSILYTATGVTNRTLTGVGFSPNLGWFARRNASGAGSMFFDTARGATKEIYAPYSTAEDTVAESLKSFDADGYTLGNNWPNAPGTGSDSWVAWSWIESATAGIDIVLYSGNDNADRDISHSLGVVPDLWIVKSRTNAQDWMVSCRDLGAGGYMQLSQNNAFYTGTGADIPWSNEMPTSAHFTVGENGAGWATNESGEDYLAYLFASVPGFSKVGTYTGNGNADGPFVDLGFKPAWLMTKDTERSAHWYIWDNTRTPTNVVQKVVWANLNSAEEDHSAYAVDFLANGFKVRNNQSDTNTSGSLSIYLAFAESPFKYATAR